MSLEGWLGIIATIVVAVLFYFLQKLDNKKSNNGNKMVEEKKYNGMSLKDINFVVPTKRTQSTGKPWRNALVFEIREVYHGYMTTIKYTNVGSCEVRKVSVSVEQDTDEMVSHTLIKNEHIFPIEMLNVGDSFEIEVECYYPKTNRYFTIEWEDKGGKHSQRNHILLSKNYIV